MSKTCDYCTVIADIKDTLCQQCGAPLRPSEEKPTVRQIISGILSRTPARATGIDVSKWQGKMKWHIAKPKIDFAIIKASENTWEDNRYSENVLACSQMEIPHGVYHFCRPMYDWKDQADFFSDRVVGQIMPVADVERHGGLSKQGLSNWVLSFVSRVQDNLGVDVMIYTRASFWDYYVAPSDWATGHPLWVAHYNSFISEPNIPLDWQDWTIWQWSADGNGKGKEYGAQSNSIDLNRFNGTRADFYDWIGEQPPKPPDPPDPDNGVQYEVTVPVLNVRNGPGIHYDVISKINSGDIVDLIDVGGADVWVEIEPGKWCAHTYDGVTYLRRT